MEAGIEYVYFIDEIFLPYRDVLEAIRARQVKFGIQTRIDLWSSEMLDLLGEAGCVSIEAGVESITEAGPEPAGQEVQDLDGRDYGKADPCEAACSVRAGQPDGFAGRRSGKMSRTGAQRLREHGVWANQPVPMFSYPGSPDYVESLGDGGRPCVGAGTRIVPARILGVQRYPGAASGVVGAVGAGLVTIEGNQRMTVLMTADTVGGVWTFALELAETLAGLDARVVLAALGGARARPWPSIPSVEVLPSRIQAGVDGGSLG